MSNPLDLVTKRMTEAASRRTFLTTFGKLALGTAAAVVGVAAASITVRADGSCCSKGIYPNCTTQPNCPDQWSLASNGCCFSGGWYTCGLCSDQGLYCYIWASGCPMKERD